MRVYIGGAFDHVPELRAYATELQVAGHEVTSHWMYEPPIRHDDPEHVAWERRARCNDDVLDIERSDAVVIITRWPSTTGGYHTELGIAIGKRIPIITLGPLPNVYYEWAGVAFAVDWPDVLERLEELT